MLSRASSPQWLYCVDATSFVRASSHKTILPDASPKFPWSSYHGVSRLCAHARRSWPRESSIGSPISPISLLLGNCPETPVCFPPAIRLPCICIDVRTIQLTGVGSKVELCFYGSTVLQFQRLRVQRTRPPVDPEM
jgi:hypothetical protein